MPRPNSRDPKQSPAALLGRRLRQAAGFASQEAGARAMGYAREVVTKAESGERVPTDQVFRTYLETFHATPGQAESLAEDLELARNLTDPVIPEFAEPWLDVEPEAAIIRLWALDVMPGLLQRYEYARAMNLIGGQDDDKAAARAAARVERAAILEGPEPTRLTAILYEPLLRRIVGTLRSWPPNWSTCWRCPSAPTSSFKLSAKLGTSLGMRVGLPSRAAERSPIL